MRLKRPIRLLGSTLAAAGLMVFALLCEPTASSWTRASVTNQADKAGSGALAFSHTYGSTTCSAGPAETASRSCTGSLTPATSPPSSGTATAADSITDTGTIASSQLRQTVTVPSCAPVSLANSKTSADPMLPRYQTAFQQTDKWGTTDALGLSGTGYATDVAGTSTSSLLGASYSVGVWFKVANGYSQGGGLLSLSDSPSNSTAGASSPTLWMDNAGKINFRISGTLGTSSTGVSAAAYNDGNWHLAVLSVAALLVSTPTLYVDDAAGVSALGLSALTGSAAYWHLGWANFTGVTAPTSQYLQGALSGGFVRAASTSATERSTLFQATSAADYASKVLALSSISQLWMYGDSGTTTFTGTLPSTMTSPCSKIDVTFSFTGPAATIDSQTLSAVADGTPRVVAAPGPGTTQSLTISTARDTSYNTDIAGLHLYAPITFAVTTQPASNTWTLAFTWSDPTSVFLG